MQFSHVFSFSVILVERIIYQLISVTLHLLSVYSTCTPSTSSPWRTWILQSWSNSRRTWQKTRTDTQRTKQRNRSPVSAPQRKRCFFILRKKPETLNTSFQTSTLTLSFLSSFSGAGQSVLLRPEQETRGRLQGPRQEETPGRRRQRTRSPGRRRRIPSSSGTETAAEAPWVQTGLSYPSWVSERYALFVCPCLF